MRSSIWSVIAILVVGFLILGGFAMYNNQTNNVGEAIPGVGGGPDEGIVITDIVTNPNQFIGQTVTINGEVDRVLAPRLFIVDQEGTAVGDELFVITQRPIPNEAVEDIPNPFQEGDQVTITGTVNRLVIAEVEQIADFDLDSDLEVEFRDRPIIEADQVQYNTDQ